MSVTGHPANAGQELPDCSAVSDAILAEREEASLQTNTLASDSLPRWLTNQVVRDYRDNFPILHLDGLNQRPDRLMLVAHQMNFLYCGILSTF